MRKKRLTYVVGIILVTVFFLPQIEVKAQEMTPTNVQQATVSIAKQKYSLLFEGQNLSIEEKKMIADDIELILSDVKNVAFRKITNVNIHSHAKTNQNAVTYRLDLQKHKRWLPEVLRRDLGIAVKADLGYHLVINRTITKAYKEALEFRNERPAMFERLNDFVEIMQTPKKRHAIALNPQKARDMFFFYKMKPWKDDDYYRKNLPPDPSSTIRHPSILEFTTLREFFPQSTISDTPAFVTLIRSEEDGVQHVAKWPPFVYVDGRWRILVSPLP